MLLFVQHRPAANSPPDGNITLLCCAVLSAIWYAELLLKAASLFLVIFPSLPVSSLDRRGFVYSGVMHNNWISQIRQNCSEPCQNEGWLQHCLEKPLTCSSLSFVQSSYCNSSIQILVMYSIISTGFFLLSLLLPLLLLLPPLNIPRITYWMMHVLVCILYWHV